MSSSFRNLLLTTTALLGLGLPLRLAGPKDPHVIDGKANIEGLGTSNVIINQ